MDIENKKQPSCLIVGAGDDTGSALARAFAREGYVACVTRRPRHGEKLQQLVASIEADGGRARAFPSDARDEKSVVELVRQIESDVGPLEVAVFNIGANVRFGITETTERVYRKVWEMGAYAGFLMGREVASVMVPRKRGTILFTGATASMRGASGFSAFAGAKFALRALAQSMARELGPDNIHVAHVIIDGAIDSNFIRENMSDVDAARDQSRILSPDDIAANYVWLHRQKPNAWTHELDLRPWKEKW